MKKKNKILWRVVVAVTVMVSSRVALANLGVPVGFWEFNDSSNLIKATIGANLAARGVNLNAVAGTYPGDGAVRIGVSSDYAVTNPIGANGGGVNTNEWTLLYDFKCGLTKPWNGILRTTTGDADIWTKSNGEIGNAELFTPGYGTGLLPNTWTRCIMRVKNGEFFDIWLDGVRVLHGIQAIDGLCSLKSVFWIFSDDDREEDDNDVSNVALWDYALSETDLADLGTVATPLVFPYMITESGGITSVVEGALNDTYTLELLPEPNELLLPAQRWPSSPVTVNLYPDAQVTVSPTAVVFPAWTGDPNDYKVTITVTAVDDAVDQGKRTVLITHSATSAQPRWNARPIADVAVSVLDNDGPPAVGFSKNSLWVGEGGDPNDLYAVSIGSAPAAGKTVTIQVNAGSQCVAIPSSLVFTSANWYIPQSVTISAIDDSVAEGTHFSTIAHTIISNDPLYAAISIPALNVAIGDNDAQGPAGIAMMPAIWLNENSAVSRIAGTLAADGQAVDLWEDQSGNRRYLKDKISVDGYPTFNAQTQSLAFNGTQSISRNLAAIAQPDTVFVVTMSTSTSGGYVFDSVTAAQRQILSVASSRWQFGAGTFVTDRYVPTGVVTVHAITSNGINSVHRINGGVAFYDAATANVKSLGGLRIGEYNAHVGPDGFGLHGEVSEFIAYSGAMTTQDIEAVEEYLCAKWTNRINVFESGNTTAVSAMASSDTYEIYLYGKPTANVNVTVTPAGVNAADIDLGNGAGQPITVQFPPYTTGTQTIKVRASQVPIRGGYRQVTLNHATASLDSRYNNRQLRDVVVSVTGSDPYCGQPNTTYLLGDLNKDCHTNLSDLSVLADNWLLCTDPANLIGCP